jgi:uncharacterized protein YuzE
MRIAYDSQADALEIVLRDGLVARTLEVDPGTLIDLDEHGRLLSVEVIRPARNWPVEEILSRYDVAPDDARTLRRILGAEIRFSSVETEPVALV